MQTETHDRGLSQSGRLRLAFSNGSDEPPPRKPPHSLVAEQSLLGAILVNNGVHARVAETMEATDFFDPLHQNIYETAGELIAAGKAATPITLAPFFENAEPMGSGLSVPVYLGQLAANATGIVNAPDYAQTIADLAARRQLILTGEDILAAAYESPPDFGPDGQIAEAVHRLENLGGSISSGRSGKLLAGSDFAGKPPPIRVWQTANIPAGDATLLSGDGGTGKSLIAAQLAVATATGRDWLGQKVRRGPVLYVGAEDDTDEMHRRLTDICRAEDIGLDRLENLHLLPLAGRDAVMATSDKSNILRPTALWHRVSREVRKTKPALVVYDTLADLFAGDENNRAQARQFVQLLRGLAIETGHAALLLAHPSLSGMASGSGTSGSTGWSNSVRSRLYLSRVRADDNSELDPNARVLQVMKANYAGTGDTLAMRWHRGVFVTGDAAAEDGAVLSARALRAETVFLELLRDFTERGQRVTSAFSQLYAPKRFAEDPKAKGSSKRELEAAMHRLMKAGRVRLVEEGPKWRPKRYLEAA